MRKVLVSFEQRNVYLNKSWLFSSRQVMRFEWLALLALKRVSVAPDQAWVSIEEIGRLPHWTGKAKHHVSTNVGRYLCAPEFVRKQLVDMRSPWAGPYRFIPGSPLIRFDIPVAEVKKRLRVRDARPVTDRERLFSFTGSFTRAQYLVFRGKLIPAPQRKNAESAYEILMRLANSQRFTPTLRLLARLNAAQVFFRLGQFGAARNMLVETSPLARRVADRGLKAQFYLALAWSYQRASTGAVSDRQVEEALGRAAACAEDSGDRAALGLLGHRTGGYLTKKGRHLESINQYLLALEAFLITGNYDYVQATCGNLGSVIHRLGPLHYEEACRWLQLGMEIARWMHLGREDAHGEMILAKIYLEKGYRRKAHDLLTRAELIAKQAGNRLNLADIKMVWGLWHQKFGTRAEEIDSLVNALNIFRNLKDFDFKQKGKYMARKFPDVWEAVLRAYRALRRENRLRRLR
jgi:tetratricopeptide (TPR) repeat protein